MVQICKFVRERVQLFIFNSIFAARCAVTLVRIFAVQILVVATAYRLVVVAEVGGRPL